MPDDTAIKPASRSISGKVGGQVEILRDRAGVPHIYADSTADLWFGVGIAMAEDRLWQMDRLRRRALGRQAEILGPSYVAIEKGFLGRKPRTQVRITPAGRKAFAQYLEALSKVIGPT